MIGSGGRVHIALVRCLGDEAAIQSAGESGLTAEDWSAALGRARQARFGGLPVAEGFRRIGRMVAQAYLSSPEGSVLAETLPALSLERAFTTVVPRVFSRLTQFFASSWTETPGGGIYRTEGKRATPSEVTLGAMEVLIERLRPSATVELLRADDEVFEMRVQVAAVST